MSVSAAIDTLIKDHLLHSRDIDREVDDLLRSVSKWDALAALEAFGRSARQNRVRNPKALLVSFLKKGWGHLVPSPESDRERSLLQTRAQSQQRQLSSHDIGHKSHYPYASGNHQSKYSYSSKAGEPKDNHSSPYYSRQLQNGSGGSSSKIGPDNNSETVRFRPAETKPLEIIPRQVDLVGTTSATAFIDKAGLEMSWLNEEAVQFGQNNFVASLLTGVSTQGDLNKAAAVRRNFAQSFAKELGDPLALKKVFGYYQTKTIASRDSGKSKFGLVIRDLDLATHGAVTKALGMGQAGCTIWDGFGGKFRQCSVEQLSKPLLHAFVPVASLEESAPLMDEALAARLGQVTLLLEPKTPDDILRANSPRVLQAFPSGVNLFIADACGKTALCSDAVVHENFELFLQQTLSAISCTREGGCVILRVGDIVSGPSASLALILQSLCHEIFIFRSRLTCPLKRRQWIVCTGFKGQGIAEQWSVAESLASIYERLLECAPDKTVTSIAPLSQFSTKFTRYLNQASRQLLRDEDEVYSKLTRILQKSAGGAEAPSESDTISGDVATEIRRLTAPTGEKTPGRDDEANPSASNRRKTESGWRPGRSAAQSTLSSSFVPSSFLSNPQQQGPSREKKRRRLSVSELRRLDWWHPARNRFCLQYFSLDENKSAPEDTLRQDHPVPRFLYPDAPALPYRRRRGEVKSVNHWGQRKLLCSEIEFISDHLPEFIRSEGEERTILLYAGAAPGTHTSFLADLFPELDFHLIDPSPFKVQDVFREDGSYRIKVMQKFFTDQVAQEYSQKKNVLFVSDIRTADFKSMNNIEIEKAVARDNTMQMGWHLLLCPLKSLLKFRLSYSPGTTRYLDGEVYLPVWGPQTTTETRLCVSTPPFAVVEKPPFEIRKKKVDIFLASQAVGGPPLSADDEKTFFADFGLKDWNNNHYEAQMFYFNTIQRVMLFPHCLNYDEELATGLDHTFDSASEIAIISKYLERNKDAWVALSNKKRMSDAMTDEDDRSDGRELQRMICEISLAINRECSPDSGRTLKTDMPPADQRHWFVSKNFDVEKEEVSEVMSKAGFRKVDEEKDASEARCIEILEAAVAAGLIDSAEATASRARATASQARAGIVDYVLHSNLYKTETSLLSFIQRWVRSGSFSSQSDPHRRGGPLCAIMCPEEESVVRYYNRTLGAMIEKCYQLRPGRDEAADGNTIVALQGLLSRIELCTSALGSHEHPALFYSKLVSTVLEKIAGALFGRVPLSKAWIHTLEIFFASGRICIIPTAAITDKELHSLHITRNPSGSICGINQHLKSSVPFVSWIWKGIFIKSGDEIFESEAKFLDQTRSHWVDCEGVQNLAETIGSLGTIAAGMSLVTLDASLCLTVEDLVDTLKASLTVLKDGGSFVVFSISILVKEQLQKRIGTIAALLPFFKSVQMLKPISSLATLSSFDLVMTVFARSEYESGNIWRATSSNTTGTGVVAAAAQYFGTLQYANLLCARMEVAVAQQEMQVDTSASDAGAKLLTERVDDFICRFAIRPLAGPEFYVLPQTL